MEKSVRIKFLSRVRCVYWCIKSYFLSLKCMSLLYTPEHKFPRESLDCEAKGSKKPSQPLFTFTTILAHTICWKGWISHGNCSLISKPGKQVHPTHYSFYSSACLYVLNWSPGDTENKYVKSLWLSKVNKRSEIVLQCSLKSLCATFNFLQLTLYSGICFLLK